MRMVAIVGGRSPHSLASTQRSVLDAALALLPTLARTIIGKNSKGFALGPLLYHRPLARGADVLYVVPDAIFTGNRIPDLAAMAVLPLMSIDLALRRWVV